MHSKFYIHRDIKPENFLLGLNKNSNIVYLIDFGVSKIFYDTKKKLHIPFKDNKEFRGTIRYASINAHLGHELSRRDDLESLGYSLILFLQGKLPWMGIVNQNYKMSKSIIADLKKNISIEKLCSGLPGN